ncbi:hypothetical protein HanPSC8_Chr07g0306211 [Helianthus annuus]|nr:hypothetical protein HanPSC8_Chr07g0306211 [Helianthus annuus]
MNTVYLILNHNSKATVLFVTYVYWPRQFLLFFHFGHLRKLLSFYLMNKRDNKEKGRP